MLYPVVRWIYTTRTVKNLYKLNSCNSEKNEMPDAKKRPLCCETKRPFKFKLQKYISSFRYGIDLHHFICKRLFLPLLETEN